MQQLHTVRVTNLTSVFSRVLIVPYFNFCSLTSLMCCNLACKCTPVQRKVKQKSGYQFVTQTTSLNLNLRYLKEKPCSQIRKRIQRTTNYIQIYTKKSDTQTFLSINSEHSTSIKNSIPYIFGLRIKRIRLTYSRFSGLTTLIIMRQRFEGLNFSI